MRTTAKKSESKNSNHSPFFKAGGKSDFFAVQTKLNIGKPKDKYENEADHVADIVTGQSIAEKQNFFTGNNPTPVQRKETGFIQEKPLAARITPFVQRQEEEEEAQPKLVGETNIQKQEEEEAQPKREGELLQRQEEEEEAVQPKIENNDTIQKQVEEEEEAQPKLESKQDLQRQEEEEEAQPKIENGSSIQKQEEEEEALQTKPGDSLTIQKQEEEEEAQTKQENIEGVQRQEEEEEAVQTQTDTATAVPPVESSLKSERGKGSKLPSDFQAKMENSLGVDLSGVKIHTDSEAAKMNKSLKAQAFTNKSDIYFNEGKFNPATKTGQHLLAHELTHTVQQGAVPIKSQQKEQEKETSADPASAQEFSEESVQDPNSQANQVTVTADKDIPENGKEPAVEEPGNMPGDRQNEPPVSEAEGKTKTPKSNSEENEIAADAFPMSPKDDPKFKAVEGKIKKEAKTQKTHKPSATVSQAAQDAAPSPANERESQAQAGQVDNMDKQEPGEFDAIAFKAKLMQRIESMQLPQNAAQADNFEDNNNIKQVSEGAKQDVSGEKNKAAGGIEQATTQEPETMGIPERQVSELPGPELSQAPQAVGAQNSMPDSRPFSQVDQPLSDNMQEVNQQMSENEVSDEQLLKANEPTFSSALNAKNEAKKDTETAPQKFRQQEQQTLSSSQQQAQSVSSGQLQGMQEQNSVIMNQVSASQEQTGTQDSAERKRIADQINALYLTAKSDVELILKTLDESVVTLFSNAAAKAKSKFEAYVKTKMKAYKSKRYSGLRGKYRWVRDKFKGLPSEVNKYFTEGRKVYVDAMDVALTSIAQFVAQKLTEAKTRIALGKKEVSDYVAALPESLQNIGKQAADGIQNQFDELENSVDSKQDDLIDALAQQYVKSLKTVDARIEEMKAANRGLIDKALDAVKGVINTIIKIKNTLKSILSSAISVIKTILADPIGFLKNLISGISQGFKNFGSNILKHLTSGLIAWLTGALGPMGIKIPDDVFSLKGIFSLAMQVMGLTWDYMRKKAVKLLGEPVVGALEKGFEIFQILKKNGITGIWTYIKQQFNDLKETVLGAIKEMVITKVIEAGIKWVLGLMSPAGAFVKAAMMIIDVVKFFIEKGRQIVELVKAFIDGVKAVASGSVSKVAQAIENALAKAIPVVIGFLASLLGLGGLSAKVQKLIKRIRKRIDKAIDKVILKAKKWFRKAGSKIKGVAGKFVKWWKAKKKFKGADGKSHKVYLTGEGNSAKLMVASNPTAFTDFISSVKETPENKDAKGKALAKANEIDAKKREKVPGATEEAKNENRKKKKVAIEGLMGELVTFAKVLFGTADADLPDSKIVHSSGTYGDSLMGTNMNAKPLTNKGKPGSVPTSAKHGVFDRLLKRRKGGSSYYVRGHLLNHNTHGPGKWENMTPLSKEGNRLHESGIESKVKAAVGSGAIVEYNVNPVYGRGALHTPDDADPIIKEIRAAEKYVPKQLTVEANILKPDSKTKEKTLVGKKNIPNPVDTAIGSYELSSTKKMKVAITGDSSEQISKNTGVKKEHVDVIKEKAESITNLIKYSQIKDAINDKTIKKSVEVLRGLNNVTIHTAG